MDRGCLSRHAFIKKLFLYASFLVYPNLGHTLEITFDDPGPSAKKGIRIQKVEPVYPRATAADVVCGKDHHMTRFRLNDKHAGLSFSVTAKKMTRIKIRWDHPDKVLFPFSEAKKTVVFPHAGGISRLYFQAYAPISGNVYLMDDQDVVIKTCPYSFLPVKRFRHSINVNVNGTEYERLNDTLDDQHNNASINYRISSRTATPNGATWSASIGFSQSESSTDSRRINSSFSYNW